MHQSESETHDIQRSVPPFERTSPLVFEMLCLINESPKSVMRTCPSESIRMLLACRNERGEVKEGESRGDVGDQRRLTLRSP